MKPHVLLPFSNIVPIQQNNNQETIVSAFREGMTMMVEMFKSVIPQSQPQLQPQLPDMGNFIMSQYKNMSSVMQENLIRTNDLFKRLLAEKSRNELNTDNNSNNQDTQVQENNPLMTLIGTLAPILAPLLTPKPAMQQAINTVAQNPQIITEVANSIPVITQPSNNVTSSTAIKKVKKCSEQKKTNQIPKSKE